MEVRKLTLNWIYNETSVRKYVVLGSITYLRLRLGLNRNGYLSNFVCYPTLHTIKINSYPNNT